MTLKECYAAMGGNYQDVVGRLRSERLIQKFVLKFLSDGSYQTLCQALAENNHDEAFRAAHTIKGMSANLSFARLTASSSALTDCLRIGGSITAEARELMKQVAKDYEVTTSAIRSFQNSLG